MRIVKPQRLGVLHRTLELGGRFIFVPSVLVCFDLDDPEVPLHEVVMWLAASNSLGCEAAIDEGGRKARAEVLLAGNAYPVGGKPAIAVDARVTVGPEDAPLVEKRLFVVGDRHWKGTGPSDPVPFTEMSTNWTHAFGGEGFEPNWAGKGLAAIVGDDGKPRQWLPNVEDPKRLMRHPSDRPMPAGFGPLDMRHPVRRKHAGTYDQRWLEKQAPGMPNDFDLRFFNLAPEDQRLERESFEGGERFVVENMHPERPRLEGRVPTLRPRAWFTKVGDEGRTLHEVALRCDTLFVLPNQAMAVAIYRGVAEVREDDAADLAELLVAAERRGEEKPLAHYEEALRNRLEGEMRALFALQETDLLPPLPEGADPMGLDRLPWPQELHDEHNAMVENQRRAAEVEREAAVARAAEAGLDPSAVPALPVHDPKAPLDPKKLAEQVAEAQAKGEEAKREAAEKRSEMEAAARAQAEAAGLDYDAMMKQARKASSGPPKLRAEEELARLDEVAVLLRKHDAQLPEVEAHLANAKMRERLIAIDAAMREAYRKNAHVMPAAPELDESEHAAVRARIEAALREGQSLRDVDLTGADLRGLDLSGVDLSGAFFEGANLTGVVARGANLADAVLARADLTDADLEGANLVAANLGGATIRRTRLAGCDMSRAVLSEARLDAAVLDGAVLDEAFLLGTTLRETSLRGAQARRVILYDLDLSGIDACGATLSDCTIIKTSLSGANLSGATISGGCMIEVDASDACFDEVTAHKFRVVHQSRMPRATFARAKLVEANFRGTDLEGARFDEATIERGDLSEAQLGGASLERMRAPGLMAVRASLVGASLHGADLREAVLQKADLRSADLSRSNLFRADLLRIHTNGATKLDGAKMKLIRFRERRDDAE
jgi:uncharacterized protein YjbI with pentapeptide repeats